MNKGFTLIELLVVVLIIGILAAIALPQYTKAVERSRAAEAMQALGDLATAQSIFYMTNNSFAADLNTLNTGDITVPNPTVANRWKLGDDNFTTNPTFTSSDDQVVMKIARDGGMYGGYYLTMTVKKDGEIVKECYNSSNTAVSTDLCALVAAGGY